MVQAQLRPGVFGYRIGSEKNLFGLSYGQIHFSEESIYKNAGWYNKSCKRIGCGDLSADDFRRISDELEDGEMFIVLGEVRSLSAMKAQLVENNPGVDYVAEHATYVIIPGQMYVVNRGHIRKGQTVVEDHGLQLGVLERSAVKALMTAA